MKIEITTQQLTPAANKVIIIANDIAKETSSQYIGTEHLLLALVRMNHGVSGLILSKAGITENKIRITTYGTGD